jgi:cytoskeletal protein CcmA (bactofilin family)
MLSNFTKKSNADGTSPLTTPPPVSAPPLSVGAAASRVNGLRAGDRATPSVIGPDLTILGNLVSRGEVQIDGEVQGDIHGSHIVIGERAKITGGIVAEEVVVRGHVMGSIRSKKVMLQSSSHVEGDVFHQTLGIEQGAFFEGKSRRSDDPMAGAQQSGAIGIPLPPTG